MKAISTRRLASALLMAAMASSAFAGLHEAHEVFINTTKGWITGDLGYVHNTADSVQYIGCQAASTSGSCFAMDSTGLSRSCSTTDPAIIEAIRSLKSDSHLVFGLNPDGTCKQVTVYIDSRTVPK